MDNLFETSTYVARRDFLRLASVGLCMGDLGDGTCFAVDRRPLSIALFRDATEIVFALAETRQMMTATAPVPPSRHFVANADEAHVRCLDGTNPIVGMSLDDVIACATSNHPNARDVRIVAAAHRGFLQLVARPEITKVAELRGRRIAVDTDTGYAAALYEILARNGLDRRRDVEIVYAGATDLRYEKLRAGEFDATLLGTPFTVLARRNGFRSLTRVIDVLGGYQAVVFAALRPWLVENAAVARQLVGCFKTTVEWASRKVNRPAVEVILSELLAKRNAADASTDVANELFGAGGEFLPDGKIRASDAGVVVQLYNTSRGMTLPTDMMTRLGQPLTPSE